VYKSQAARDFLTSVTFSIRAPLSRGSYFREPSHLLSSSSPDISSIAELLWPDCLTAFTSCLPCLCDLPCLPNSHTGPIRLSAEAPDIERVDECRLRGLLTEKIGATDAGTLSLHLTVSTDGRRKKSASRARNVLLSPILGRGSEPQTEQSIRRNLRSQFP
jgi:hypothetical protein